MPRKVQYFSAPEKADLWRRWKAGDSLSDIARALNRKAGTVHGFIRANTASRLNSSVCLLIFPISVTLSGVYPCTGPSGKRVELHTSQMVPTRGIKTIPNTDDAPFMTSDAIAARLTGIPKPRTRTAPSTSRPARIEGQPKSLSSRIRAGQTTSANATEGRIRTPSAIVTATQYRSITIPSRSAQRAPSDLKFRGDASGLILPGN